MKYSIADFIFETSGNKSMLEECDKLDGMSAFKMSDESYNKPAANIIFTSDNLYRSTQSEVLMEQTENFDNRTFTYAFRSDLVGGMLTLHEKCSDNTYITTLTHSYSEPSIIKISCCNKNTLRFMLWAAFGILTNSSNILPIHASAIVFRHQAILFIAESGTGKSTQSALWCKTFPETKLLNDDGPVIKLENGKLNVYGSPWSGKTPRYIPYKFPVKAIVKIARGENNKIEHLNGLQAFSALYPSMPYFLESHPLYRENIIDKCSIISSITPIYALTALPNQECVELVKNTLFDDNK